MNILLPFLALISIITLCHANSQPIIRNTKKYGCIDGHCGPLCSWDGAKLFPGYNMNQQGKCRLLACTSSYDIVITTCPFDMTGQTVFVGQDMTKPYPECCGRRVPRKYYH